MDELAKAKGGDSMSGFGSVFALLAAVPLTFGATRRVHNRWRARWKLRNHEPLEADAREGDLVFVSGVVRALEELLIAPLSGRACVAYRSRVMATSPPPETMQLRPFVLECEGGDSIVVAGHHAVFGLPAQRLPRDNYLRERSFMARHAVTDIHARFSETLVEIGSTVLVGGTLVLVPSEAPPTTELGFRDEAPPDPRIVGSRESPLVIVTSSR